MTSKDIKMLAGSIVMESNYSDSAKKQLLNFIANEATDHQIKTLILDGNIETIAEDAKAIVDKRFDLVSESVVSEVVEDTIAFLSIGRDTICEFIESQGYEGDQLKEMKNFIMNEASDYQILSVLTDDILPDEASNPVAEAVLFEGLNMATGTNFIALSEYGISSILNEQGGHTPMNPRLIAIYKKIDSTYDELKRWTGKSIKGPKAAEHVKDLKDELNYLKGEAGKIRGAAAHAAGAVTPGAMASKVAAGGAHKTQRITAGDVAKGAYEKGKEVAGKAVAKGKELAGAAKEKISAGLKDLPSASAIGGKISAAATSPAGMAVGGLAAAALLGYGAYKIYKNYFSQAAKKCAGSPDKSACMKAARSGAVKAQIADLSKGASACSKAKDPAKCKAAVQNKIAKLRSKMA